MASELDELLAQFPEWTAAIDAWEKKITPVDYLALMQAARGTDHGPEDVQRAAMDAIRAAGEHPRVEPLIRRLCEVYLTSGPDDRGRIYRAFASKRTMRRQLENYYGVAAQRLHSPAETGYLRTVLAAVAIEDGQGIDWRDTLLTLVDVAKAAVAAGIDWRTMTTEVIALANATPGGSREWPNAEGMLQRFANVCQR